VTPAPTWLPPSGTLVKIGHRGAARELPGNTLASYQRAVDLGCHMVEIDVHATADGVLILAHDNILPTKDGPVEIAITHSRVLRKLDVGGEPPPLLTEALALLKDRCGVLIDLKEEGFERAIASDVYASGATRVMACGDRARSLLNLSGLHPDIELSWTLDPRERFRGDDLPAIPTPWTTVNHRKLSRAAVNAVHDQGVRVIAWTVDDIARRDELISWGIDGITTNDPRTMFI
jgi:glycerophosphoryl diester phosphodiesterase